MLLSRAAVGLLSGVPAVVPCCCQLQSVTFASWDVGSTDRRPTHPSTVRGALLLALVCAVRPSLFTFAMPHGCTLPGVLSGNWLY